MLQSANNEEGEAEKHRAPILMIYVGLQSVGQRAQGPLKDVNLQANFMKVSLTPPVVTLILSEHKATEKSVNKDQEGNHSCLEELLVSLSQQSS